MLNEKNVLAKKQINRLLKDDESVQQRTSSHQHVSNNNQTQHQDQLVLESYKAPW